MGSGKPSTPLNINHHLPIPSWNTNKDITMPISFRRIMVQFPFGTRYYGTCTEQGNQIWQIWYFCLTLAAILSPNLLSGTRQNRQLWLSYIYLLRPIGTCKLVCDLVKHYTRHQSSLSIIVATLKNAKYKRCFHENAALWYFCFIHKLINYIP